jgi:hypothetical protein
MAIVLFIVCVGAALGVVSILIYITNPIIKTVKGVLEFAQAFSLGDVNVDLGLVKKVKPELLTEYIPNVNEPNSCWLEYGSFSENNICKNSQELGDCTACKIYQKVHKNELELMVTYLTSFAHNLRRKAEIAKEISDGNLTAKSVILSDADILGQAFNNMSNKMNAVLSQTQTMANGVKTDA